jgi:hypothetical protein
MNVIPKELVETIRWEDHKDDYDQVLCSLGGDLEEFYVVNPYFPDFYIKIVDPNLISEKCLVWKHGSDWVVKKFHKNWIQGWEVIDIPVLPQQKWIANPDIDHTIFFKDDPFKKYKVPEWDAIYDHVWYLDPLYSPSTEKVWVYKFITGWSENREKDMGYLIPDVDIKYNPDIPKFEYTPQPIPLYELHYRHTWYLDPLYTATKEKIWAFSVCADKNPLGDKDMGYIKPNIDTELDVIFISYNEPNAEENWQRVLEKAPHALRVDGVKGIFEAHKSAAELATTDMFYVVDGDAYLADDWSFTFSPTVFDRDCVFVFNSQNPINGLVYGYGGVKIFPRNLLLDSTSWSVDMTTSIGKKLKVIDRISNVTAFNTDELATWRSAFRECAKLAAEIIENQDSKETQSRLDTWVTIGDDQSYGEYAKLGARSGYKYGVENKDNIELLKLVNDRDWLAEQFKLEMIRHNHNEISH